MNTKIVNRKNIVCERSIPTEGVTSAFIESMVDDMRNSDMIPVTFVMSPIKFCDIYTWADKNQFVPEYNKEIRCWGLVGKAFGVDIFIHKRCPHDVVFGEAVLLSELLEAYNITAESKDPRDKNGSMYYEYSNNLAQDRSVINYED